MKTILFPTDFSQASVEAVNIAADLARLLTARIIFLYAVRSFADRDKFIATAAFNNEDQAAQALKKLAARFSGEIPCEYLVRTGSVADEIASVAKETKAALLVMNTSGAGEIPDTLAILNSTTTELISRKICPVLAIPAGVTLTSFKKIVLATDREPIDAPVLTLIADLARQSRAEVILLTVFSEENVPGDDLPDNKNTTVEQVFTGIPYSVHALQSDDVISSIQQFAEDQRADLVTVVSRKRGLFDLLFRESVSQKLALHSRIPLLVLPE
jgi:nucleotide-binding universal stress UspA family protein